MATAISNSFSTQPSLIDGVAICERLEVLIMEMRGNEKEYEVMAERLTSMLEESKQHVKRAEARAERMEAEMKQLKALQLAQHTGSINEPS